MKKTKDVRAEIYIWDEMPEGSGMRDPRLDMEGRSVMGRELSTGSDSDSTFREVESKLLSATFDEEDRKLGITTSPQTGYSKKG
jgi:hypothetical protein